MEKNILEQILEGSMEPTNLPLEILREITDGFSTNRIIGEGGFGTVYKGIVGNRYVAVKKIKSSMTIDDKLFRREVNSLMEVNHQNVVRFLGLCAHTEEKPMKIPESRGHIYVEIRERLLCFDYISNGSLDKKITDELRGLEWEKRYEIIKGICTGLHYLHVEKCILHMDLKPANILLDDDMLPKITDFGLSRPEENSQTMSADHFISVGYCALENLFGGGRMSVQSDMYSLGVIIIELVTGQKGVPGNNDNILRRWRHRWSKSEKETSLKYHEQVTKCIEIGSLCQNFDPYARPSISKIMSKFVELERLDKCRTISHESMGGEIKPPYWEDDMLGVEPLELQFSNSGNDKQLTLSCSVELSNNTDSFIAFKIQKTSPLPYSIEPNRDIVKPRSKYSVNITLPAANTQDHNNNRYAKEFIVRSIKVNKGFTTNDMNEEVFDKHLTGHHVDEIYLSVISKEPCNKEVTDSPTNQAKQYASSEARLTPVKPRSVQLVIKNNTVAPLLEYNKKVMLELTGADYISYRPGLDLVAVVDVGRRLQGEQLKTAMRFLVRELTPMDRLCIITFSKYNSKKLCPLRQITEATQRELEDLISKLEPSGGTYIEAGLQSALNVLADREVHVGRVAGIMLVSGGQRALFGDATSVDVGDVPVYTFCLGATVRSVLRVLDEVASKSMGGMFTHVVDQDTGGLTMAFSRCLACLLTCTVANLELLVAAVRGESKIVKVTAGSYPQEEDVSAPATVVTVRFGNLYSTEVRKVIVELLLPRIYRDHSAEILDVTYSHNCSAGTTRFVSTTETLTVRRTAAEFSEEEKHSNSLLRTEMQELVELFKTQETYTKQGRPYVLSSESSQRLAERADKYLEQAKKYLKLPSMDDDTKEEVGALPVNVASREDEMQRLALDVVPAQEYLPGDYIVGRYPYLFDMIFREKR